jgi:predicted RNA binding protein YcfA (HicA-like mRNA interferase family)
LTRAEYWPLCGAPDWVVKRQSASHRLLTKAGWPDYEFAFHDHAEVGPKMLTRVAKNTGLKPEDLQPESDLP